MGGISILNVIIAAVLIVLIYAFVIVPWKSTSKKASEKGWPIGLGATLIILSYIIISYLLATASFVLGVPEIEGVAGIIVVLIINAIAWFLINFLIGLLPDRIEKKKCKYCSELIIHDAVKCKHCGSNLSDKDSIS
ncbi:MULTISPECIES: hypothetical protein [unclassified Photorhabdus]|uniref:hypothetical protein n=1 Tax=unclassified Photorhabdus TaxID=2620880 RepID=UPI000DCDE886|nr:MULTISPECIES: hypothetical protein [unclassified Photorhabdus]RAW93956.1 hypothetical protein CKY03_21280 [Photorhabdus sp. S9-53]RAW94048.1 hypothetical protein CKY05_21200 [Photorhabdus sp. S10-54]RAW97514.1 hypothetical protein CKY04_21180 [Photorhabdus sp. S8-52]